LYQWLSRHASASVPSGYGADSEASRAKLVHYSGMLERSITTRLVEKARAIGFDLCGVARAENYGETVRLPEWLDRGYAGEMGYMHDARRRSARDVMPEARSVIVCAMNYNAPRPYSVAALANKEQSAADESALESPSAWISRYAWGDDYHDVLKPKLEELNLWLRGELQQDFHTRVYVDTGPVLERVAAKYAGLGWLAKNTCLINERLGSWLFLGVILTDLDLAPTLADGQPPPADFCGTCTRCIDACPTDALVAPYVLDARRCISYLTIELRGAIPEEFRPAMDAMVFGCDICQDVCPWNRKSPATTLASFLPREIADSASPLDQADDERKKHPLFMPELDWLITLTEDEFRCAFQGSPVKRTKWRGLLRNACVALGNSNITPENPAYARIVERLNELASGEDTLLAEHAMWALDRLRADNELQTQHHESHPAVERSRPVLSAERNKLTHHVEDK
jgi:epoxyqueuosine reductase